MWFRVAQFGKRAEAIADSIKKGDEVLVLGTVRESKYQGKDGSDKTSLEITATEIALIPRLQKAPRAQQSQSRDSGAWQQGW